MQTPFDRDVGRVQTYKSIDFITVIFMNYAVEIHDLQREKKQTNGAKWSGEVSKSERQKKYIRIWNEQNLYLKSPSSYDAGACEMINAIFVTHSQITSQVTQQYYEKKLYPMKCLFSFVFLLFFFLLFYVWSFIL